MYKQSKYNYTFPVKDKIYYVNTLRRTAFPMKKDEHKRIKALFGDPITFELEYPSVFKQFFQWGFFVNSNIKEEKILYYQFVDEYIHRKDFQISILVEKHKPMDDQFIQSLELYITEIINSNSSSSITIIWNGNNILSFFDSYILPFSKEIEKICKLKGITFNIELNIAISNNPIIHNKIFHEKGIPTYDKYISIIDRILADLPYFNLNLNIFYNKEEELDLLKLKLKDKVNLFFEDITKLKINPDTLLYIKKDLLYCARKNMVLIDSSYHVFSSYIQYTDKTPVGNLNSEGKIEWQLLKRERDLAVPWFSNNECERCKLLPLYKQVCCNYQITYNTIVCPVKCKAISVEKAILSIIETVK